MALPNSSKPVAEPQSASSNLNFRDSGIHFDPEHTESQKPLESSKESDSGISVDSAPASAPTFPHVNTAPPPCLPEHQESAEAQEPTVTDSDSDDFWTKAARLYAHRSELPTSTAPTAVDQILSRIQHHHSYALAKRRKYDETAYVGREGDARKPWEGRTTVAQAQKSFFPNADDCSTLFSAPATRRIEVSSDVFASVTYGPASGGTWAELEASKVGYDERMARVYGPESGTGRTKLKLTVREREPGIAIKKLKLTVREREPSIAHKKLKLTARERRPGIAIKKLKSTVREREPSIAHRKLKLTVRERREEVKVGTEGRRGEFLTRFKQWMHGRRGSGEDLD